MLKLLHPDGQVDREQMEEYVAFAMEMRRRVKEQLKKMGGLEYWDVKFSYSDHALLARATVRAARRESAVTVEDIAWKANELSVTLASEQPLAAKVRLVLRDRCGSELRTYETPKRLTQGVTVVTFARPEPLPGGQLLADAQVLDARGMLGWGGGALTNDLGARIARVTLAPTDLKGPGEVVRATVNLEGGLAAAKLRVEVRDGFGRLVHCAEAPATETTAVFGLDTSCCLGWVHSVKSENTRA